LKVIGGAIQPNKSFIYPIAFTFKTNGDYSFKLLENIDFDYLLRTRMTIE